MTIALLAAIGILLKLGPDGYEVLEPDMYGVTLDQISEEDRKHIPPERSEDKGRWRYAINVYHDAVKQTEIASKKEKDTLLVYWEGKDCVQVRRVDLWREQAIINKTNLLAKRDIPEGNIGDCKREYLGHSDNTLKKTETLEYLTPPSVQWKGVGAVYQCRLVGRIRVEILSTENTEYRRIHELVRHVWKKPLEPYRLKKQWIFRAGYAKEIGGGFAYLWRTGPGKYVYIDGESNMPENIAEAFLAKHPSVQGPDETIDRVEWFKKEFVYRIEEMEETIKRKYEGIPQDEPWCTHRHWLGKYCDDLTTTWMPDEPEIIPSDEAKKDEVLRLKKWYMRHKDELMWSEDVMRIYVKRKDGTKPKKGEKWWWDLLDEQQKPPNATRPFLDPGPLDEEEAKERENAKKAKADGKEGKSKKENP